MTDTPDIHVKASKYEAWLNSLYEAHNQTAEDAVKKAYKLLTDEGKKPIEARAIIEHDLGKIWKAATLQQFMPEESKDPKMLELRKKRTQKQETARKTESNEPVKEVEKILQVVVNTDGSQAVEPLKPKEAKKIVNIIKDQTEEIEKLKADLETTKKSVPAVQGTKADPVATKIVKQDEIDRLREKVGMLHDKLQPYDCIIEKTLWGKSYHFKISVNPMDQTANFELVRKSDLPTSDKKE